MGSSEQIASNKARYVPPNSDVDINRVTFIVDFPSPSTKTHISNAELKIERYHSLRSLISILFLAKVFGWKSKILFEKCYKIIYKTPYFVLFTFY